MAESRLITNPFEADCFNLWHIIEVSCEVERNGPPKDFLPLDEMMAKEIARLDQKGGPAYRERVRAAAIAYGEAEIQDFEAVLADARAAVKLIRQPPAGFLRAALRIAKPDA